MSSGSSKRSPRRSRRPRSWAFHSSHLEDPVLAPEHLDAWLTWAPGRAWTRSSSSSARSPDTGTGLAAIRLGLDNPRLEGLDSRIRLISHRSFGFQTQWPLIALVYLCRGGIPSDYPDDLHPQTDRGAALLVRQVCVILIPAEKYLQLAEGGHLSLRSSARLRTSSWAEPAFTFIGNVTVTLKAPDRPTRNEVRRIR